MYFQLDQLKALSKNRKGNINIPSVVSQILTFSGKNNRIKTVKELRPT
jgi:hypothetical protein